MLRTYDGCVARAEQLLADGFGTKQAQANAKYFAQLAYEILANRIKDALRADGVIRDFQWNRAYDELPYSLAHWNEKQKERTFPHGFTFRTYGEKPLTFADAIPLIDRAAELLARIKAAPVVRKPPERTPAQRAKDAKARTCQVCGRPIFAELGVIAHHGYQRPGDGYQMPSCFGARFLPFEADRSRLAAYILARIDWLRQLVERREEIATEKSPLVFGYDVYVKGDDGKTLYSRGRPVTKKIVFSVTRGTLEGARTEHKGYFRDKNGRTFDQYLARELEARDREIADERSYIKGQQARYDAWKPTERWNDKTEKWEKA